MNVAHIKHPRPLDIFFDENFPRPLVEMLKAFDQINRLIHHLDEFPAGVSDVQWIASLSLRTPKPIVISGDGAILRRRDEKDALASSDMVFVYLQAWAHLDENVQASKIVTVWPNLYKELLKAKPGDTYRVKAKSLEVIKHN